MMSMMSFMAEIQRECCLALQFVIVSSFNHTESQL